jgi:hypothetical protein
MLDEYGAAVDGRGPVHRLPVLGDDDAARVAGHIHGEMEKGEQARALVAREAGHTIACERGCNHCCANVIAVYEPEALRAAAWLAEPAQAQARARFLAAYPRWKAALGDGPERLRDLHGRGEVDRAEALYAELQRRRVMCAFNRDGSCLIHPVRPDVCRHAHALDTPDRCRPGSTERPLAFPFPPLDAFVDRALALFRAIDRRRNGTAAAAALCETVHRLLGGSAPPDSAASSPPSRNAPCPCGSGKKYKRCCGG